MRPSRTGAKVTVFEQAAPRPAATLTYIDPTGLIIDDFVGTQSWYIFQDVFDGSGYLLLDVQTGSAPTVYGGAEPTGNYFVNLVNSSTYDIATCSNIVSIP